MNPDESWGGRIHGTDPFATPDADRSPVRRFRGRLAAGVTLWTTPGPCGLTVSSMLVADGEPGRVLGLIDEESDFWDAASRTRRFAVVPLSAGDQQIADRFAGLMPAPGGLFAHGEWTDSAYGPVPAVAGGTWAGCTLDTETPVGWSLLVQATIAEVHIDGDHSPLIHHRGRYLKLPDSRSAQ